MTSRGRTGETHLQLPRDGQVRGPAKEFVLAVGSSGRCRRRRRGLDPKGLAAALAVVRGEDGGVHADEARVLPPATDAGRRRSTEASRPACACVSSPGAARRRQPRSRRGVGTLKNCDTPYCVASRTRRTDENSRVRARRCAFSRRNSYGSSFFCIGYVCRPWVGPAAPRAVALACLGRPPLRRPLARPPTSLGQVPKICATLPWTSIGCVGDARATIVPVTATLDPRVRLPSRSASAQACARAAVCLLRERSAGRGRCGARGARRTSSRRGRW